MISIIIPILNEEKYIGNLLNSLRHQTYKDFEVIAVDANSKDKTRDVLLSFSDIMNIRYINSKNKKGVGVQRNIGVKKAHFDSVLFLDADVVLPENFLEDALKEIEERRLTVASCIMNPLSSKIIDKLAHWAVNFYMKINQYGKNPKAIGACLFSNKGVHEKIDGFDEKIRICEDYDYVTRAIAYGKFRILNKCSINISVRRFDKEGRLRLIKKYLAIESYRKRHDKIKEEIFNYEFGKG